MSRLSAFIAFAQSFALTFALTACGGGKSDSAAAPAAGRVGPTGTVAALSLPSVTAMKIAQPTRLAASATDRAGAAVSATLTWSSADPSVATVDAAGT